MSEQNQNSGNTQGVAESTNQGSVTQQPNTEQLQTTIKALASDKQALEAEKAELLKLRESLERDNFKLREERRKSATEEKPPEDAPWKAELEKMRSELDQLKPLADEGRRLKTEREQAITDAAAGLPDSVKARVEAAGSLDAKKAIIDTYNEIAGSQQQTQPHNPPPNIPDASGAPAGQDRMTFETAANEFGAREAREKFPELFSEYARKMAPTPDRAPTSSARAIERMRKARG